MKNKRSKLEDKNKKVQDKQLKESFYNKRLFDMEQTGQWFWKCSGQLHTVRLILCWFNFKIGSYGGVWV